MRPAGRWLVLALVVTACSGRGGTGTGPDADAGWPVVTASLAQRFDASSPNVCTRGAADCLDVLIEEMGTRLDRLLATCDHRAPFALAYLATTRALRDATRSTDPASAMYLRHLDAVFARMYFDATDGWASGGTAGVPPSWRLAFDAAARRQVSGLGDLLAAMNAHITRDLSFALAAVGLTLGDGRDAKAAFDQVNAVLAAVQQPMMAELAQRLDPTVAQADLSRVVPAAGTVAQVLAGWREESWISATRLVAAAPADRPAVEASIEAVADARGASIVVATSYVPFLTSTVPRDQFCAVNGRR